MIDSQDGSDCTTQGVPGPRSCCGRRHAGLGRGSFVEPVALAALLVDSSHGYDVRRAIQELTGGEIDVDTGGLYRVLRRFEAEGFAVSDWDGEGSGPPRRHYEVTERGHELARDWVAHLRERERLAKMMAELLERALSADNDPCDSATNAQEKVGGTRHAGT